MSSVNAVSRTSECIGQDELRVVLLAPFGRDASLIQEHLTREEIVCCPGNSVTELIEAVGDTYRVGVIVIAEEAVSVAAAEELSRHLAGESAWSDLPVLLLARPGSSASRLRAALGRRSAHVLGRPLHPMTLTAAIRSAIEIRRRQYEVRDLLEDAQSLSDQLTRRADQLRRLSLQLSDAEEKERRRLAVYVHDDLQQVLAGVMFHLDVTARRLDDPEEVRAALVRVRGLVADAIEGSRTLAHQLSPVPLRRNGLVAALKWLAEHVRRLHGLDVRIQDSGCELPAGHSIAIFLFRAAQELLLNVAKHSQTSTAEVSVTRDETTVRLTVADQGVGFDSGRCEEAASSESFGLYSIRERAELLGGMMNVDSAPGCGTTVTLRMPDRQPIGRYRDSLPEQAASVDGDAAPGYSGNGQGRIRVVLVDDHVVMRGGLRLLLTEHAQIEIIDEYSDGLQAVEAADAVRPDLILMDVAMPVMDGIEATREIKRRHPEIRVIGLSMFDDLETSEKMLEAGAECYISKAGPSTDLIAAILGPGR